MLGPNREKLRLNLESDLARHARLRSGNFVFLNKYLNPAFFNYTIYLLNNISTYFLSLI